MQRLLLCFSFLIFSFTSIAQKYKPVDAGSKVHFNIKNFGIETGGDLSGLAGDISFIPANITTSSFDVSVSAKTIDTDNDMRDKDLKEKKYFDADTYPAITIKSTKIDRTNKSATGWYYFTGTLTMHSVTKPIEFPFSATLKGNDYLFAGGFTINRLDYGVGGNSAVLSNTVKVSLSVLAKKS
ncbi:MAG TPA: YceI family protein [Chitinophagaceae bacterium]